MGTRVEEFHRRDGSLIYRRYVSNNTPHREDGPAFESFCPKGILGRRSWYLHGRRHRLDGPALESFYDNGTIQTQEWYIVDKLHREDGPAVEQFSNNGEIAQRVWYCMGKFHREDGPAVEFFSLKGTHRTAYTAYYLNGEQIPADEYSRRVSLLKLSARHKSDLNITL